MDFVGHDIDNLKNRRSIMDQPELIRFFIMKIMKSSKSYIGAWELQIKLAEMGINLSTATIGRYLKLLDNEQLTVKVSNKGRALTSEGERVYEERSLMLTSDILHQNMRDAVNQSEYSDLLDIYTVRMSIELEAVRLCCRYATPEVLQKLELSNSDYRRLIGEGKDFTDQSLGFHMIISEATRNHFMDALLRLLIFEQKKIENKMVMVETRNYGPQYVDEHDKILSYIRERDENGAVECLKAHFDTIMETVRRCAENAKSSAEPFEPGTGPS